MRKYMFNYKDLNLEKLNKLILKEYDLYFSGSNQIIIIYVCKNKEKEFKEILQI